MISRENISVSGLSLEAGERTGSKTEERHVMSGGRIAGCCAANDTGVQLRHEIRTILCRRVCRNRFDSSNSRVGWSAPRKK